MPWQRTECFQPTIWRKKRKRKGCHHFYLTLWCDTLPMVIREGRQIKGNKLERKEQKTLATQRSSGPLGETMPNNLNFDRWAISKVDIFSFVLGSCLVGMSWDLEGVQGGLFEFIKVLRYKHMKISKVLMYLLPHEFYLENTSYFDYVPSLVSLLSYESK